MGEIWHAALATLLGPLLIVLVWVASAVGSGPPEWFLFRVDPVLGLLAVGLLTQRRRWPLPVAVLTAALTTVAVSAVPAAGISYELTFTDVQASGWISLVITQSLPISAAVA